MPGYKFRSNKKEVVWGQVNDNIQERVYIAYASDAFGSNFSLDFVTGLDYIAIKHTTEAIANPSVSNFDGLWKRFGVDTVAGGLELGSTYNTAYRGDYGTAAYAHSLIPHAPSDANNYTHPESHSPSIIDQDVNNRFVSDAEKAVWNAKAGTDSPAFTGTPTVPTASVGTANTQAASTKFVSDAVANISAGFAVGLEQNTSNIKMDGNVSVGSLATTARADHVHPTDTSRAPVSSPAFTGVPTVPTASVGTANAQAASTAFVSAYIADALAGYAMSLPLTRTQYDALGVVPLTDDNIYFILED